jgi:hypothetical protein
MGRRMTPTMDMSPPIFSAISTICYHIVILGPVHASNSFHTNYHEIEDMSKIENHE